MEAIFQKMDVPEVVMRERGAAPCPSSEAQATVGNKPGGRENEDFDG